VDLDPGRRFGRIEVSAHGIGDHRLQFTDGFTLCRNPAAPGNLTDCLSLKLKANCQADLAGKIVNSEGKVASAGVA
jgi:hypothetical protein